MADQQFNVRDAVWFFGGPAELTRRLRAFDSTLRKGAIEKWMQRGQIPGSALIKLSQLARSEGRNFEIQDFITTNHQDKTR